MNRFSTSKVIDLQLMIEAAAGTNKNLALVEESLAKIIQMTMQKIGIQIDTSQLRTLEQINEIIQQYGISLSQAGKQFTVMAKNAEGLGAVLTASVAKRVQKRDAKGRFTGEYEETPVEVTSSSLSQNQLTTVQSLITAEKELLAIKQQRYQAERQGWQNAEQGSAQQQAYQEIIGLEEQREQKLRDILELDNVVGAAEESQIGHTVRHIQAELELAEAKHQAAMADREKSQADAQAQGNANRYLQITRQLYSAEEQLARARQSGTSEAYITQQQQVIAGLRQQQQGVYQLLEGTEQYEALLPQLNTMEQQHQANLLRLGGAARTATAGMMGFKAIIQNIIVYGIGYRALYALIDAFRQTIDISKELNAAMTDLRIATGASRQEAEAMIDTYNDLAQQIGATTKEVVDSSVTWLRQGYSEADTNKLVYDSMVLSKVGMLESAEATEYLTSAMKGYKVEVDDAMGIIDKLTKIDLNAAVSSGELAEAMSKTANSARLAGVSMDELLGYIATVAEVTQQSASTVGTSFKSIFSRFSKISAGSFVDEETGEDLKIWVATA